MTSKLRELGPLIDGAWLGRRVWIAPLLLFAALLPPQGASSPGPDREGVPVPKDLIRVDDGDSLDIRWKDAPVESIRILGIDTPEVLHLDHGIPFPQAFGEEARGFLAGCLAAADEVRLLRSGQKDPFGRTLGYILVDGKNYSVLVIAARLAIETVSRYGDNGLPEPAAACVAAAKAAGPVPFEDPHVYRKRMRVVTEAMKREGTYPKGQ